MKDTVFTKLVDEVVAEEMATVDDFIKTEVEPWLDSLGNPEKLIGPWPWSDQQIQILVGIYGQAFVENFIATKEIAKMHALEKAARA